VDGHLQSIYEGELRTQCEFIMHGAREVNRALVRDDRTAIWFGLQGILIAASNASKLLWGSRKIDMIEARRSLRERAQVTESSPLNSRDLRNDFEHFDERLERWFAKGDNRIYFGRRIGKVTVRVEGEPFSPDHFAQYQPDTGIVTFWERTAELRPIVAEAHRIATILRP
jgi:hypothetical protein